MKRQKNNAFSTVVCLIIVLITACILMICIYIFVHIKIGSNYFPFMILQTIHFLSFIFGKITKKFRILCIRNFIGENSVLILSRYKQFPLLLLRSFIMKIFCINIFCQSFSTSKETYF